MSIPSDTPKLMSGAKYIKVDPADHPAKILGKIPAGSGHRLVFKGGQTYNFASTLGWGISGTPESPAGIVADVDPSNGLPAIIICDGTAIKFVKTVKNFICQDIKWVFSEKSFQKVFTQKWPQHDATWGINYGLVCHNGSENLRFNRCEWDGFEYNLSMHGPVEGGKTRVKNVLFQKCYIHDAGSPYKFGGQGGYYDDIDGLVYQDCFIIGNGLAKGKGTEIDIVPRNIFQHNIYHNKHAGVIKVRRCVIVGAAAYCLQARGSYDIDDSVLGLSPIALMGASRPSVITDSTIIAGEPIPNTKFMKDQGLVGVGGVGIQVNWDADLIGVQFIWPSDLPLPRKGSGAMIEVGRRKEPGYSPPPGTPINLDCGGCTASQKWPVKFSNFGQQDDLPDGIKLIKASPSMKEISNILSKMGTLGAVGIREALKAA